MSISRKEAILYMTLYRQRLIDSVGDLEKDIEAYNRAIKSLSAEQEKGERVRGKWIDWLGCGNEWECSNCKCSIESHGSIAYKFCPMCGCQMDKVTI